MNIMTKAPTATHATSAPKMDVYDAKDLIKDGVQASILLNDQTYFLRITRAGKLILTK